MYCTLPALSRSEPQGSLLATPCMHPTGYGTPIHRGRVSALWLLLFRSLTPVIGLCAVVCLASTYLEAAAVWLPRDKMFATCLPCVLLKSGGVSYSTKAPSSSFLLDCVQCTTVLGVCQVVASELWRVASSVMSQTSYIILGAGIKEKPLKSMT